MEDSKKIKIEELIIDPEFKNSIPPLSDEEYNLLKDSITHEGCRDSLIIWKGKNILLDGHNRRNILIGLSVQEVNVIEKDFAERNDARIWIIENQFGRRNISKFDRCVLALKLEDFYKAKAKENLKTSTGGVNPRPLQKSVKAEKIDTQKELAKIAGVSHDTISKVKKIEESGDPETREKIRKGDLSIKQAYDLIKEKEKSGEILPKKEKPAEQELFPLFPISEQAISEQPKPEKEEIKIAPVVPQTAPIQLNPETAIFFKGMESFNNKNYEEALNCFEEILSICRKKLNRPEQKKSHYFGVL